MNEEHKCRDCKWLTGRKNIRGIECMNPKNQEKWNKAKTLWMGELRKDSARYKQGSALACKKFEAKESKPMSRYIKFDDAVKVMACEMYAEAQSQGYDADDIEDFMPEATAWLNDAPSIDIEPKRGEWIPCTKSGLALTELMRREGQKWYGYRCSNCNHIYKGNALTDCNFCPNCGAKMKGADDE